jgi:hypothetical protein
MGDLFVSISEPFASFNKKKITPINVVGITNV